MATQLPIIFRENDSLDDFLDRMLLRAYLSSLLIDTNLLRTNSAAINRLRSAKERIYR